MTTVVQGDNEKAAALKKCRDVLTAVASDRRKYGPISTHAQTALQQLVYSGLIAISAETLCPVDNQACYRPACAAHGCMEGHLKTDVWKGRP